MLVIEIHHRNTEIPLKISQNLLPIYEIHADCRNGFALSFNFFSIFLRWISMISIDFVWEMDFHFNFERVYGFVDFDI